MAGPPGLRDRRANPAMVPALTTPAPIFEPEPDLQPFDPVSAVKLQFRPTYQPALPVPVETSSRSSQLLRTLGLDLAEPTPVLVDRYQLDRKTSGLVVTNVDSGHAPADRGGLEPGMVVTDAGGKLVGNLTEFPQDPGGSDTRP